MVRKNDVEDDLIDQYLDLVSRKASEEEVANFVQKASDELQNQPIVFQNFSNLKNAIEEILNQKS